MRCPKCDFENPDNMSFCGKCGSKLSSICPECGFINPPGFQFCGKCGAKLAEATASVNIPKLEDMQDKLYIPEPLRQRRDVAQQELQGENRLVTALFADISGFTPLSNQHSSEKVVNIVNDCFKVIVDTVFKYEGDPNRFIGDNVLAFFGAPIAHENDPERAIMSALEIRNKVRELSLDVSIGINTGMMYFGTIGTNEHHEVSAYGPDINLAKRLQEYADPGQILVGSGTHRLTRRAFDFDVIQSLNLKGFDQPIIAYSVQQMKLHPEKLRGIEGLRARMIGREHEFADAKEAVDEWLSGHGQIVSIIGEAGIGKSRLVSETKTYIEGMQDAGYKIQDAKAGFLNEPESCILNHVSIIEGRCVSIGQPISYWPFIDILKTYFNLSEGDDTATISRKVTESITQLMPQSADETLPLLGQLLSIKYGNDLDNRLKFATSEQIRHQTLMRLRDIFETLAKRQPLLLIIEDLHWSDGLSLDLISLLMDELANTPLMLLCVYRPEKEHPVSHLSDQAQRKCLDRYTEITLRKLSTVESRQLVDELLMIDNLPESVKTMILDKSEGNPFFMEEVIRSLIDRDLVYREEERWKARDEVSSIDVPDTIQSVILARVDRLQAEAKYVLQCASVIGRLFKYRLLEHLAQQERNLNRYLSEFEERDLVYPEHTIPELEYAFKHALTQEATYQGILERKKMEFHHQVGEGIETLYRERLEEYYGELAYHYARSADKEKAVDYLIKAGDRCKQLYANQDAIRYFNDALSMLDELGETNEHEMQRLKTLESLGDVYNTIGKHEDAIAYFEKALGTKQGLSPTRLAELYFKIGYACHWLGQHDKEIKTAQAGLAVLGDDIPCPQAALLFENLRQGYQHTGDWANMYEYASRNAAIVRELGYFDGIHKVYAGISYTNGIMKGEREYAVLWAKEGMEICERHNDKKGIAECCHALGDAFFGMNFREAIHWHEKSISIAEDIGYADIMMYSHVDIGVMLVILREELEEAEEHLRAGLDIANEIGNSEYAEWAHRYLGELYFYVKQELNKAEEHFKSSADIAGKVGYSADVALAYGHLGELYCAKQEWDKAIDYKTLMADLVMDLTRLGKIGNPMMTHPFLRLSTTTLLAQFLCNLEKACEKAERMGDFISLCGKLMEWISEVTQNFRLTQWYLEPTELSGQFTQTIFLDEFNGSVLNPEWQWVNPRSDCCYELKDEPSWLKIQADSGCDLYPGNFESPRLLQEISGDFAIETKMATADEDTQAVGGLFVWKDENNYIRFERGMNGTNEIGLSGSVDGNWDHFGRGMLVSDIIYLRIERIEDKLSAYCSKDGGDWFTCGEVNFPAEDPIQIGIHAIGGIGGHEDAVITSTRFDYFRVLNRTS
jgi:predicted ATPase/class 3 adenylate cyclase